MLRSLEDIEDYKVKASDGDIGRVVRFLIDDENWTVRYLVAKTDSSFLFDGREVLISPISFRQVDWSTQRFHLALTMDKIKESPSVDFDKPVSRQHEWEHLSYFGYPHYWGAGHWGVGTDARDLGVGAKMANVAEHDAAAGPNDVHLRSDEEIRGYRVQGSDETIGHIEDFIVDDETWEVRYLVVNTRRWWLGKKVLVSPLWATNISWAQNTVSMDLSRAALKDSPEWNASAGVNRAYEARLYDYYGRPAYWEPGKKPTAVSSAPPNPDIVSPVEHQ